jgi:hypothetical protein
MNILNAMGIFVPKFGNYNLDHESSPPRFCRLLVDDHISTQSFGHDVLNADKKVNALIVRFRRFDLATQAVLWYIDKCNKHHRTDFIDQPIDTSYDVVPIDVDELVRLYNICKEQYHDCDTDRIDIDIDYDEFLLYPKVSKITRMAGIPRIELAYIKPRSYVHTHPQITDLRLALKSELIFRHHGRRPGCGFPADSS